MLDFREHIVPKPFLKKSIVWTRYHPTVKTVGFPARNFVNEVTYSSNMFSLDTNLVGGAGTQFDAFHTDKAYAHIDGGTSNPGYLTAK